VGDVGEMEAAGAGVCAHDAMAGLVDVEDGGVEALEHELAVSARPVEATDITDREVVVHGEGGDNGHLLHYGANDLALDEEVRSNGLLHRGFGLASHLPEVTGPLNLDHGQARADRMGGTGVVLQEAAEVHGYFGVMLFLVGVALGERCDEGGAKGALHRGPLRAASFTKQGGLLYGQVHRHELAGVGRGFEGPGTRGRGIGGDGGLHRLDFAKDLVREGLGDGYGGGRGEIQAGVAQEGEKVVHGQHRGAAVGGAVVVDQDEVGARAILNQDAGGQGAVDEVRPDSQCLVSDLDP